eukprot:TRINITY_DN68988_c0_g1_i1.p1 TRINITY_DN68988_c0_g1~~TRINITY_DN68988_c0_g1_i1.p1  ORF type:complete len:473 (-),score=34.85 TRINITY_DN68988_c0_g1_i1:40-1428(-)
MVLIVWRREALFCFVVSVAALAPLETSNDTVSAPGSIVPANVALSGAQSVQTLADGTTSLLPVSSLSDAGLPQWTPVAKGHVRRLQVGNREVRMRTLAVNPPLFLLEDFLASDEARQLAQDVDKQDLTPSVVAGVGGSRAEEDHYRKSLSTFLSFDSSALMRNVSRRVSAITQVPLLAVRASRDVQAVVYHTGGYYYAHHDSAEGMDRYLTFLYVIENAEKGGETSFPYADDLLPAEGLKDVGSSKFIGRHKGKCAGLKIKAKAGDAILWYNHHIHDGSIAGHNDASLHVGCRVKKGRKVVANNWVIASETHLRDFKGSLVRAHSGTQHFFLNGAFTVAGNSLFIFMHKLEHEDVRTQVDLAITDWLESREAKANVRSSPSMRFVSINFGVDQSSDNFARQTCKHVRKLPRACIITFGDTEMVADRSNFQPRGRAFDAKKLAQFLQDWHEHRTLQPHPTAEL